MIGFGLLIAGLSLHPEPTLRVLWQLVVPLLPLSFFLSPGLWRAACPFATAGLLASRSGPPARPQRRRSVDSAGRIGLLLLLLLVPLRRALLEHHATALILLLLALLAAAFLLSRGHAMKSGFCNTLCPVLPVERLYGQAPLFTAGELRCAPCTGCSPVGCPDRGPRLALLSLISHPSGWVTRPQGTFLAGFPGFVVGFGLLPGDRQLGLGEAYASPILGFVVSWLTVAAAVRAFRLTARSVAPWAAWAAGSGYYWFATRGIVRTLGQPTSWIVGLRAALLGVLAAWLVLALRRSGETPT